MSNPAPPNLTEIRLNRGFSIRALADKLDVPEQSIRRLESGAGVHPANAKKIADWAGCTVVDLMPVDREAA